MQQEFFNTVKFKSETPFVTTSEVTVGETPIPNWVSGVQKYQFTVLCNLL